MRDRLIYLLSLGKAGKELMPLLAFWLSLLWVVGYLVPLWVDYFTGGKHGPAF
jgi:hypothetical protein